jgi:hypothetical protein
MLADTAAHIYFVASAMDELVHNNYSIYAATDVLFGPGIPKVAEGSYDVLYTDPTAFYGIYPSGSLDLDDFVGRIDADIDGDKLDFVPLNSIAGYEKTSLPLFRVGIQEGFKRIAMYTVTYDTDLADVELLSAGVCGKWFSGTANLPNILHYTTAQFKSYLKDSLSYMYITKDSLFLHITDGNIHSFTELLPTNYIFEYDDKD